VFDLASRFPEPLAVRTHGDKQGELPVMKRMVDRTIRFVLGMGCRLLCRMSHRNSHLVPKEGAFILACNHATWIDSLLLLTACPRRVRFILTETFHRKPLVHMVTHNTQCIPVNKKKPRSAIMAAIHALRNGEPVGIFPEGGFTRDGSIRGIQRGVEVMARGAKCPVVPVVITGLFGTALALRKEWRKDHLWKKSWPKVRITFGEPIPCGDLTAELLGERLTELLEESRRVE
jgi:1-acyl-sn-glycerol-3-phosphate acyltransferase